MANGTLTGSTIRAQGAPMWDHTYVLSSHGHSWPCWGRAAGGAPICSGIGNADRADCLSQPSSHAGIAYGKTGVCHQTANRILWPVGATVSAARGYRVSMFAYGVFGLDLATLRHYSPATFAWPELQTCRATHAHP